MEKMRCHCEQHIAADPRSGQWCVHFVACDSPCLTNSELKARPDDGPVHVEFLTHDKLLKALQRAIEAFKRQPDLIVRFDPN